ncbi:hypothetical protein LDO31_15125 [Luteimonas sp. XNQY3]|nr:hypothetical protein [Luteimonas sp. XNQY3]MCD9007546.1 hypothetical protein [Luteimonas sp. XNQY3]
MLPIRWKWLSACRIGFATAGTALMLSGCCVFGVSRQAYDAWTSPTLPDNTVAAIQRQCDADARKAARERFQAHLAWLGQQCAAEQPFSDFTVLDESTGKPIEGSSRESVLQRYRNACRILAETPRPTPEDLSGTCADCRPRLPAESCYSERGLVRETRYRPVCKQMRML